MRRLRFYAASVGQRTFRFPLITPPLGIMYLGAIARERFGADVKIINQRLYNTPNDELVRDIIHFSPDIVGLSAFTPSSNYLKDICAKVKQALPHVLVIVGGPHASALGSQTLQEIKADIAVPSEGEVVFESILQQYLSDKRWDTIPGISWRNKNDEIINNPGKIAFIENLDTLPFPAYDLADLPAYWRKQSMPPISYRKYAALMSSRGCPYGCKWCHNIFGRKFRAHSAERVIEEILYYNKRYGIVDFEFQDDIFNFDHKRLIDFCDLIHKHNVKVRLAFPNGLRTDILDETEIDALVSAGTYFCAFALETGSPRLQKEMGKRLDINRFLHNVEYAVKKGIFSTGFVMLGFPTETAEEMQTSVDVACASALHTASFFIVTPFPNTEVYHLAMKTHKDTLLKHDYTDHAIATSLLNVSAELDEVLLRVQRKANKQFYSPKRIYRIIRDTPEPLQLILYVPHLIDRLVRGLV